MSGLQLRSLVKSNGELELSLVAIPTPKPGADEVVVRVEAAPINPTDIFLLLGAADLPTLDASEAGHLVQVKIPAAALRGRPARQGQDAGPGDEGHDRPPRSVPARRQRGCRRRRRGRRFRGR